MVHRRRILLINRNFQLKFSFFVCSWIFVLSLVFPAVLYTAIEAFIRILTKKVDATTLQIIQSFQAEMITAMVIFMIIFAVTIFMLSLFLSHRIAGPVYRVQSALERWSRGNVEKGIKLRKADHFGDLADAYNAAAEVYFSMRETVRTAADKIQKVSEELEPKHKAKLNELVADLQSITQKKQ